MTQNQWESDMELTHEVLLPDWSTAAARRKAYIEYLSRHRVCGTIDAELIKQILEGDRNVTINAFIWQYAPGGQRFWSNFHTGGDNEQEAHKILRDLLEAATLNQALKPKP